jgi:predicted metal-dependent hydrolase|tara:strand:- start:652 stop:840 length:189 start_codon:yes stop_codon:yes gene_type:complete
MIMQNLIDTYDMQQTKDRLGYLLRQVGYKDNEEERALLIKQIKDVVAMCRLVGVITINTEKV